VPGTPCCVVGSASLLSTTAIFWRLAITSAGFLAKSILDRKPLSRFDLIRVHQHPVWLAPTKRPWPLPRARPRGGGRPGARPCRAVSAGRLPRQGVACHAPPQSLPPPPSSLPPCPPSPTCPLSPTTSRGDMGARPGVAPPAWPAACRRRRPPRSGGLRASRRCSTRGTPSAPCR